MRGEGEAALPAPSLWHALADAADRETLPRFRAGTAVRDKHAGTDLVFDPVTEADREAERAIRDVLSRERPDDAVLGEEHGASEGGSGFRWVLDPIDGTRAFMSGVPVWMTLIGLERNGRAVAGLASQPVTGERFLTGGGGEASLIENGRTHSLQVSACADPAEATLMTVDPYLLKGERYARFEAMRDAVRLVRYSADAYAFCALAAGRVDVVVEAGVQPYDIGALIPIVEAAGGIFTDWNGGRPEAGGDVIAAATPELHRWAMEMLRGT